MNSSYIYYLLALIISSVFLFHCAAATEFSKTNSLSWKPRYSYQEVDVHDDTTNGIANEKPKSSNPGPVSSDSTSTTKCKNGKDKCSTLKGTMESSLKTIEKNTEVFQQLKKKIEEMMEALSEKETNCGEENGSEEKPETKPTMVGTTVTTTTTASPPQRNAPLESKLQPVTAKPTTGAPITSTDTSTIVSHLPKDAEPSDSDRSPVYKTYVGQENDNATLTCDQKKGQYIYIIDAYYGPSDVNKCKTSNGPFTRKAGDQNDKIRALCGHWSQSTCSFKIDSSNLGDSCKGVPKKLRISYYCSAAEVMGLRRKASIKQ